jgi:prepilin-type N-terminal cleavage/methylation domain-containing protein
VRARGDDGLTLVELLVSTSITGMLATVIAGAFFVGVQTTDTANDRLAGSRGAQLATSFFPADVSSATAVTAHATPCAGADPNVATITAQDPALPGPAVSRTVEYTCQGTGDARNLVRIERNPSGVETGRVIVVFAVTAAEVTCLPTCGSPRSAQLSATETGGFAFSVSGLRRAT